MKAQQLSVLAVDDTPSVAVSSPGWNMGEGAVWLFVIDTSIVQSVAQQTHSAGGQTFPIESPPMPPAIRWRRLDSASAPVGALLQRHSAIEGLSPSPDGLKLGSSLASGFDLDNDGFGDLLIGASGHDGGFGGVFVLANPVSDSEGHGGAGSFGGTAPVGSVDSRSDDPLRSEVGLAVLDARSNGLEGTDRLGVDAGLGPAVAVLGEDASVGTLVMLGAPHAEDANGNDNGAIISAGLAGYGAWLRGAAGMEHVKGSDAWNQRALLDAAGGQQLRFELRAFGTARINATAEASQRLQVVLLPRGISDPEALI